MSIQEKAKAYDEALEKARTYCDNAKIAEDYIAVARYENIFPELRESEDERIRKELIDQLQYIIPEEGEYDEEGLVLPKYHERINRYRAYLEKQKERSMSAEEVLTRAGLKPYKDGNKWCILAGDNIQEGICGFGDTIDEALYQFLMEVLEIQKKQKTINNSNREKIISRATSEKQVVLLSESDGNAEIGWDTRSLEDTKKLLEYGIAFINKQLGSKPAEWSEEDEKAIERAIDCVRAWEVDYCDGDNTISERLKSLRPQPHWKPSEQEKRALLNPSTNSSKSYKPQGAEAVPTT